MQYALVNNIRSEPTRGTKGTCTSCGKTVIAKCGNIKVHHWAHTTKNKCDSWWENETEWHREWKSLFPEDSREITFFDPVLMESHRADIYNKNGITIELQNSPLTIDELRSRNDFYKRIVWVVNGKKFKGFSVIENIPDPTSSELKEYDFQQSSHLILTRKSEATERMVEMLGKQSKEFRNLQMSAIHYSFTWNHPHKGWYTSSAPVFIDFGGEWLFWLKQRRQMRTDYFYLLKVSKDRFLKKYSV